MEGYCSTGQSPQWAVVPMEEDMCISQRYYGYSHKSNIGISLYPEFGYTYSFLD